MIHVYRWVLPALLLLSLTTAHAQEFMGPGIRRFPPVVDEPEQAIAPVVNQVAEPLPEPALPPADAAPEAQDGTPEEAAAVTPEMLPNEEDWWFVPASWYKPLSGSLELGLNGTEGNSQTFNIRVGANAKYELPWVKHTYEALHIDNSADGVQTALNGYFDGRIIFPFGETKWSSFIHQRTEYDDFREYNSRLSADGGLAYDFWKNDGGNLQARFGLSTSRELGGPENEFVPEVTAGLDWTWKIDDRQSIVLKSDYYPSVEDFTQYRINSNASWEIIVSKAWGLSAKLSAINRYDSTPGDRKPSDMNYAALMLWAF